MAMVTMKMAVEVMISIVVTTTTMMTMIMLGQVEICEGVGAESWEAEDSFLWVKSLRIHAVNNYQLKTEIWFLTTLASSVLARSGPSRGSPDELHVWLISI